MEAMQEQLGGIIGTANRLEQEISQILATGGTISPETKLAFLTGALARVQKDMGVILYLQNEKVIVRPAPATR